MISPGDLIDVGRNGGVCLALVVYVKSQGAVSVLYMGDTKVHHVVRKPSRISGSGDYCPPGQWEEVCAH